MLKHRAGKAPRPLVIAPVRNRIVQRALLRIPQLEQGPIAMSLGGPPGVLRSEGSVGGVPGFSSADAVRSIQDAAVADMTHHFCSDIRSFFTDVPVAPVVDLVRTETGSAPLSTLFETDLRVELFNGASPGIREWSDLFPDGGIGVAQGCSLSAFCASVTLRDFDDSLRSGETRPFATSTTSCCSEEASGRWRRHCNGGRRSSTGLASRCGRSTTQPRRRRPAW